MTVIDRKYIDPSTGFHGYKFLGIDMAEGESKTIQLKVKSTSGLFTVTDIKEIPEGGSDDST